MTGNGFVFKPKPFFTVKNQYTPNLKYLAMKNTILATTAFFLMIFGAQAQKFDDLDKSPMDVEFIRDQGNAPMIRIIYSRPQMKGREIFGGLVPYDKVWRTGANEATEITLYQDMIINGKPIDDGTYTLYTIPGEEKWTVIINEAVNVWGAYDYDKARDVLRVEVPVQQTAAPVEVFSMTFQPKENGANLLMGWDDVYVSVPFEKE